MVFELIVVDTKEQANVYNVINTEEHRIHVSYVGEGLCGLHYRGQRPNKLTRLHSRLVTENEIRWEHEVMIPTMAREWRDEL